MGKTYLQCRIGAMAQLRIEPVTRCVRQQKALLTELPGTGTVRPHATSRISLLEATKYRYKHNP